MPESRPTIGTCEKCGTTKSYVYEYSPDRWICKANGCWAEEQERDSGKVERDQQFLADYRSIVRSVKSD